MSSLASHIRITLASASSDAVSLASDGFLNTDVVPTTSAQTTSLLQLAEHATWTLRAFGGAWDDTDEQTSKTWCDECLNMIKTSGNVALQRSGATLLAAVMTQLSASPYGYMEKVYARCAEGVVWLLKHCRATSLKGSVGLGALEVAAFECCNALFNVLKSPTAPLELRKCSTTLLSEVVPQLTSMLSLGTTGVTDASSLECLLQTTTLAMVMFEHQMRPYLGPLRGAFVRSRCFVGMPPHILTLVARCWSLVVSARSRTQKPKDGHEGNSERNSVGTNAVLDVPAHFWQEECMRVVTSIHDLLLHVCPAAAKKVDPQEQRLFNLFTTTSDTTSNTSEGSTTDGATSALTMNDVDLSAHLEMLSYLLGSMLSTGPTGPPGSAMLAAVPVVAIVDVLERCILASLNCQVGASDVGGGLAGTALLSFVPRLYEAFGRIFPALVDAVSLLRYSSRVSTTLVRGLRFVSHGPNNVSCPSALVAMLKCCSRYAIRQGGAMRQSFVEPIVMVCVREIYVRMISQPTHQPLIGAITGGASQSGKGRKGKKRGRGGGGGGSSSSSATSTPVLSTEKSLPISQESNASHRRCCVALISTIECLLQASVHHVGTVVRRDIRSLLYGMTNSEDPRPSCLMGGNNNNGNQGGDVQNHSGIDLRLAVYDLLTTCALLPSASGNIGGGSLLGHAMALFHDGLNDADWRIVQTCRRSIVALRSLIYPQIAPMRTYEPKIAPLAKRYKTTWPTDKKRLDGGGGGGSGGSGGSGVGLGGGEEGTTPAPVVAVTTANVGARTAAVSSVVQDLAPATNTIEDDTPIEVERVVLETMPAVAPRLKATTTSVAVAGPEEEEEDEDFPDIVA